MPDEKDNRTSEDDSTVSYSPPDREPDRIGPYKILQKLGEGGMGVVYLAEQTEPIRRRVALKLIKLGMDSKQVIARFEAERQALALMNHANVAKVFDAGTTEQGRLYFVMEYVKGVPITEFCDQARLTNRQRLGLFIPVCQAIHHAHQKGIIHRDIKPSNVLVSVEDGTPAPKVIDFGVAKATAQHLTERTLFTQQGVLIGTPEYMSPEQAELTAQDVDVRTDVYSLGVVLYELLVGALPFEPKELRAAGFDELRRKIREDEPPKPSTRISTMGNRSSELAKRRRIDLAAFQRQLRGDLDWITMKSLEKQRERRYASASELAADIIAYLENRPVTASPPTVLYRAAKALRRFRSGLPWFGVGAVVAVLGVGAIVLVALGKSKSHDPVRVGNGRQITQAAGLELDPEVSPDGKWLAFVVGRPGATRLRLHSLENGTVRPLSDDVPGAHRWPRWSPDGNRIVFQSSSNGALDRHDLALGGDLYVVQIADNTSRRVFSAVSAHGAASPTWSPDGNEVAFVSEGRIHRKAIDGATAEVIIDAPMAHSLSWAPDTSQIAFVSGNPAFTFARDLFANEGPSSIQIVSLETRELQSVTAGIALHASPVWSPDGQTLLYISGREGSRDVYAQRVTRGSPVGESIRLTTGLNAHSITISQSGNFMACAVMTERSNVWSLDLAGTRPGTVTAVPLTFISGKIEEVDVSPDGEWLALSSTTSSSADIFRVRIGTEEFLPVTTDPADDFLPRWSPDGKEIAFHSTRTGNREVFVIPASGGRATQVTFSPETDWVFSWGSDGQSLYIVSSRSGNPEMYLMRRGTDGSWSSTGAPMPITAWSADERFTARRDGECMRIQRPPEYDSVLRVCPWDMVDTDRLIYWSWGRKGATLYLRSIDSEERTSFWSVDSETDAMTLIATLDADMVGASRARFSVGRDRLYYVAFDRQSDIWMYDLTW